MNEVYGVVCYWQYVDAKWSFVESYAIDDDGYPLIKPIHTGNFGTRHEWDNWTCNNSILGRAVTIWQIDSGIRLLAFNPPDLPKWLSHSFIERLCESSDWPAMLEWGPEMYFGTIREVHKILDLRVK